MKKLVMISGPPGVGKTTVCSQLFKLVEGCAWLDADWCWMVNPWVAKTLEQKRYVEDMFARILRGYLENEGTNTVLFSWVMRSPWMFDLVASSLSDVDFQLYKIALVCGERTYIERMHKDGRRQEQIDSPDSMELYYQLGATVIDTSEMTVDVVVQELIRITDIGETLV